MQLLIRIFLLLSSFQLTSAIADEAGSQFTSFAGIDLGTLTLDQITERFGPSKIQLSGDGGESREVVCYRTKDGYLSFISGEMGGPEHTLLAFGISSKAKHQDCPNISSKYAKLKLRLSGLHLGMTKNEFEHEIGKKVKWNDHIGRAFLRSKELMTKSEIDDLPPEVREKTLAGQYQNYYDVVVSIVGKFTGNELTEFEVWKVESL